MIDKIKFVESHWILSNLWKTGHRPSRSKLYQGKALFFFNHNCRKQIEENNDNNFSQFRYTVQNKIDFTVYGLHRDHRSALALNQIIFEKANWLFMINLSIIVGFRGRKMDSWRRKKYFWACDSSDWCSRYGSYVVVGSSTVPYQTVPYRTGPLYTRLRSIRRKWDHPFPGDTTSPFHLTHNTRLKLSATY